MADFRLLTRRYKQKFGVPCGKDSRYQTKYLGLCKEHGEELVLEAFDEYATANAWRTDPPPAIWFFFNECSQWVEDIHEKRNMEGTENISRDADNAAMIADRDAARKRVLEELERKKVERDALKDLPPDKF